MGSTDSSEEVSVNVYTEQGKKCEESPLNPQVSYAVSNVEPYRLGLTPPPIFEESMQFSSWRRDLEFFLSPVPARKRGPYVIQLLSRKVRDVLYTTGIDSEATEDDILSRLAELFPDVDDRAASKREFWGRRQQVGESVDKYANELRILASKGHPEQSPSERENLVFERFILGLRDSRISDKFARKPPASLKDALIKARSIASSPYNPNRQSASEDDSLTVSQLRSLSVEDDLPVDSVRAQRVPFRQTPHPRPPGPDPRCRYCQEFGRFARHCGHNPDTPYQGIRGRNNWTRGFNQQPAGWQRRPPVNQREKASGESTFDCDFFVPTLSCIDASMLPLLPILIDGKEARGLVDTGAACTILHSSVCPRPTYDVAHQRLRTANGSQLDVRGTTVATVGVGGCSHLVTVLVSDRIAWQAILGVDFLRKAGFRINLKDNTVRVQGTEIPLLMTSKSAIDCDVYSLEEEPIDLARQIRRFVSATNNIPDARTKVQVESLLNEFAAAFAWDGAPLGRTNVIRHRIETGDAEPTRQGPRRLPLQYRDELEKTVAQMLEEGIIQPSKSPWASPIVLVKKKDGKLRLCVDYRKLNDVTRKDGFPLPRIDDLFDCLNGAKWFCTLDLASGYWQVEVEPRDREKTAFVIPSGLYEFRTMPFGLANAPATFQRLMQIVLQDMAPRHCLVYLDDVIVFGRTIDELLQNLRGVLTRLIKAGLRLKPSKCILLKKEVSFLGHVVSEKGIQTDSAKIDTIKSWPTPQSVDELRQFLGLASYYRRFVRDFARIAGPLHRLTEVGRKFVWSPECQNAFEALRCTLVTAPILTLPDLSETRRPFVLDTDASDFGIGAVLSQLGADNSEHVVAYGSRCLNKSERNYCTTRKEMLALVFFMKHFRHYLLGKSFIVRTDHQALKWLQNFREAEGQVARWQEQLQAFDYECQHRPGRQHKNADALSRRPCREKFSCPTCSESHVSAVIMDVSDTEEWSLLQKQDPETRVIYQRLEDHGEKPTKAEMAGTSWEAHCLWSQWHRLRLLDGVLYLDFGINFAPRVVVPQSKVQQVLTRLHQEAGHAGQRKMDAAASQRFWWPQQRRDIVNFCNNCEDCIRMKPPRRFLQAPLQPIVTGYPNEIVGVDIVGPLPETPRGNRYILVMVDLFTKWCEAVPIAATDAETTAQAIVENWVCRWGAPEQLHSDRGSNFESVIVGELCHLLDTRKSRTTAYHPQGNGQVERTNRSIKTLLKAFTDEHSTREWDRALSRCLLAYRSTVHVSTGYSPHSMVTGREMRLPLDLTVPSCATERMLSTAYGVKLRRDVQRAHELARMHLESAHRHQRDYYDKKAFGSPVQPGQLVYVHRPTPPPGMPPKLYKEWVGPFVVEEVYSDSTCRVRDPDRPSSTTTVHFNRLKLATMAVDAPTPTGTPVIGSEVEITTDSHTRQISSLGVEVDASNLLGNNVEADDSKCP